jgi:regulator of replication initiation timing
MTAMDNAARQAAHREKKHAALEEMGVGMSKLIAENAELRAQNEVLKAKMATQAATHAKQVQTLKNKLLKALEAKLQGGKK